ncbi:hypothetical protein SDC9_17805 [bioreactor metagenome]|uniref:Uncharacterized protein n=1 Tax=bioreactor metagenome TaxID=1076179 RepID=A0A644TYE9_9ZZZZ|nr:hypothetical protein [Methanobrevibacter sp.]MEA4956475.1 hypothetical protein [Methanobrevibacter sp.]
MYVNIGNGHAETHLEFIKVLNVRIEERDPLKPVFDELPFLANFENEDDYLKLVDYGVFHIELEHGKILVDCKLNNKIKFIDENTDVEGYYSYSKL